MIKVKVCGLTNIKNAAAVFKAGPDYAGFNFYRNSPRYVGPHPGRALFESAVPDISTIGIFVDEDPLLVTETAADYGLSMVQLHGTETPQYCESLKLSGLVIIKAFGICDYTDFEMYSSYLDVCDYFLFDRRTKKYGGSGEKFNWRLLDSYNLDKPFFLGGGIAPGDVPFIRDIKNDRLMAVDINSRFETAPGIKDPEAIRIFIEELKRV